MSDDARQPEGSGCCVVGWRVKNNLGMRDPKRKREKQRRDDLPLSLAPLELELLVSALLEMLEGVPALVVLEGVASLVVAAVPARLVVGVVTVVEALLQFCVEKGTKVSQGDELRYMGRTGTNQGSRGPRKLRSKPPSWLPTLPCPGEPSSLLGGRRA